MHDNPYEPPKEVNEPVPAVSGFALTMWRLLVGLAGVIIFADMYLRNEPGYAPLWLIACAQLIELVIAIWLIKLSFSRFS